MRAPTLKFGQFKGNAACTEVAFLSLPQASIPFHIAEMARFMGSSACKAATARPKSASSNFDAFRSDVIAGLQKTPKSLPCKYLYDRRGSHLFDEICELPEYYLTRTELSITEENAGKIADEIGPHATLIELGSGNSVKTRILLDNLHSPAAYVPVDISGDYLNRIAAQLSEDYENLKVLPKCADFTGPWELPASVNGKSRKVVYFPGSTIGNFRPAEVRSLLNRLGRLVGRDGAILIGIDLQKEISTIEAAYNDSQGVTSDFSLNLLRRINRELRGNLDLNGFFHWAKYDAKHHRVDIRLVSKKRQSAMIAGHNFNFEEGESIQTEYSYKHTIPGFASLAEQEGFALKRSWTDDRQYFALLFLVRTSHASNSRTNLENYS